MIIFSDCFIFGFGRTRRSGRRTSLQLPASPNLQRSRILRRRVLRGRKVRIRLASGRRLQQIRPRGAEGRRQYAGILLRRSSRRPPTNCHLLRGRRLRFCCRSQLRRRSPVLGGVRRGVPAFPPEEAVSRLNPLNWRPIAIIFIVNYLIIQLYLLQIICLSNYIYCKLFAYPIIFIANYLPIQLYLL